MTRDNQKCFVIDMTVKGLRHARKIYGTRKNLSREEELFFFLGAAVAASLALMVLLTADALVACALAFAF